MRLHHVISECLVFFALFNLSTFLTSKFKVPVNRFVTGMVALISILASSDRIFQLTATLLFVISEIDHAQLRIPDVITKPALFLMSILFIENFTLLAVVAGWFMSMYLLTNLAPEILGRGDVKLIGALVLLNNYFATAPPLTFLLHLLFLASLLALPGAYLSRRRGIRYPFAPAISGAVVALFAIGAI